MKSSFYKYQGTGNDFVVIDNRTHHFPKDNVALISHLCDRRFGIGADGFILLENHAEVDFRMVYYNADGKESSMCGNGGRCIVAFANYLKVIENSTVFMAIDGLHEASIEEKEVCLKMQNVTDIKEKKQALFLDTGSPHHVQMVDSLDDFNVVKEGARLRYGVYGEKGSNINFVSKNNVGGFNIRTYERGVEDETLSCGTGATAVAVGMHFLGHTRKNTVPIHVLGGTLDISFEVHKATYRNVYLKGPAEQVFKGEISW